MLHHAVFFHLSPWKFGILALFAGSTLVTHYRGKVRFPFFRQLTDHSTYFSPYNVLMLLFSRVPTTPYLSLKEYPELETLTKNWTIIREEALGLFASGQIKAASGYTDWGFNSFFRSGWKRFYLTWYGDTLPSAKRWCPRTIELRGKVPSVRGSMFALLPPGSDLVLHRDPYAGSLRYHLGLSTPNSPDCKIVVDGIPAFWRDEEAILFDETFHTAQNLTDRPRLILFCGLERKLWPFVVTLFNRSV